MIFVSFQVFSFLIFFSEYVFSKDTIMPFLGQSIFMCQCTMAITLTSNILWYFIIWICYYLLNQFRVIENLYYFQLICTFNLKKFPCNTSLYWQGTPVNIFLTIMSKTLYTVYYFWLTSILVLSFLRIPYQN